MSSPPRTRARPSWLLLALVAIVTIAAFLPALQNGFVSWDDEKNFLTNPHYRGLGAEQLRWMWTTFHMGHYIPLSWMTLGLDYTLWGMNPFGYHLTSVLGHAVNAGVLYFLSQRLLRATGVSNAGPAAAIAALLFSVHPLRVESVAWVTERRDVLSLGFSLLSILAWLRSTEANAPKRWYWSAVALFACALLSKATVVTLPAVLLLIDLYPLRRLGGAAGWWSTAARRVWLEKVPFALLSGATALLSIIALKPPAQLGLAKKIAVSAYSLVFYLGKTVLPTRLSPLYEMPQKIDPLAPRYLACYAIVIAISLAAWAVRRRAPGLTAAWVGYVVVSLPMLGVVQNGPAIAADRYSYHAAPILALLAGTALWQLWPARFSATARTAVASALIAVLSALTWIQNGVWHDSTRLWSHALELDSESSIAHSAWAVLLLKAGNLTEALSHSRRAIELAPNFAEAHDDYGVALARAGKFDEAVAEYRKSIELKPSYGGAHNNLGVVLARQGKLADAVAEYQQSIVLEQDNADAHTNWGNALVRLDKPGEAIPHYQLALNIRPDHADAEFNWGVALARQGKMLEAIEHFRAALAIQPDHAEARDYLEKATQLLQKP